MELSSARVRNSRHCRAGQVSPARRPCLLVLLTLLSALGACCSSRTERPFPFETLLLDGASFPLQGVKADDFDPPGPSGSCYRAGRSYSTHLSLGHQVIYEYSSPEKAARSIAWHESILFADRSADRWATPPELAFQNSEADFLQQKCTFWGGVHWRCIAVAQYGEFVFRLRLDLYPGALTLSDFEEIFQAMDERAVSYIKEEQGRASPSATPVD
jgi:hypothetical protein